MAEAAQVQQRICAFVRVKLLNGKSKDSVEYGKQFKKYATPYTYANLMGILVFKLENVEIREIILLKNSKSVILVLGLFPSRFHGKIIQPTVPEGYSTVNCVLSIEIFG